MRSSQPLGTSSVSLGTGHGRRRQVGPRTPARIIEILQAEKAALADGAKAANDEIELAPGRPAKVGKQLDRFRAMNFWNLVGQEIFAIIFAAGVLTPAEIMPELRSVTIRGAALHEATLNPATPKKKMGVRVSYNRSFEPRHEGRYARTVG